MILRMSMIRIMGIATMTIIMIMKRTTTRRMKIKTIILIKITIIKFRRTTIWITVKK